MRKFLLFALLTFLPVILYAENVLSTDSANVVNSDPVNIEIADTISNDSAEYTELEEFVIERRVNLVQSDGAKLTYNVSEDPERGTSNILDILRKVPGVMVDAEDNVKVNGQSSFRILMNGRDNPMLSGDIKSVLKSLPAGSIKKIEVISEPGAKYEAEGTGGILNIITDSSRTLTGTLATASVGFSNRNLNGNLNLRQKLQKVMLDVSASYSNSGLISYASTNKSESEDLTGALIHIQKGEQTLKNRSQYAGFVLNMSWEPDTLNLFTISANYGFSKDKTNGKQTRTYFDKNLQLLSDLRRDIKNHGNFDYSSVMASYQHNFGKDENFLVISYQLDYYDYKSKNTYSTSSQTGMSDITPYVGYGYDCRYFSHIAQIDYSNRFNPHHLLEAGAKMNLNNDNADQKSVYGQSADDAVEEDSQRVKINQLKDIYAAYASYSGSFGKLGVKAGLRYEYTRMGGKYKIGDYPDFISHLNDLVPNAAVSFNISSASSFRLAYQMRISRPFVAYLNPFVVYVTPGVINYGNPNLKSAKSHNFVLSYSNYESVFTGQISLNYKYVNDNIENIVFSEDGVLNNTYANIGLSHQATLNLNGNWNPTNNLQLSTYLSTTYSYMKADSELLKQKNCGWQFYGNFNVNYTLPYKIRASAYAGMWTPWITLQAKGDQINYYYGLGLSKSWLKEDALTLQLFASNIFTPRFSYRSTTNSSTFNYTNERTSVQWTAGLNLTFRFGALKAGVKRTATTIEKEAAGNMK